MTRLSQLAKADESRGFIREYHGSLLLALLLTALAYGVLIVFGQPLLELLVGYGKFGAEDVLLLWQLLVFLGGILVAGSVTQIVSAAYYARGDTRRPATIGALIYTLYLPLKLYAFFEFGLIGLATATSLHYTVALIAKATVLHAITAEQRSAQ